MGRRMKVEKLNAKEFLIKKGPGGKRRVANMVNRKPRPAKKCRVCGQPRGKHSYLCRSCALGQKVVSK